MSGGAMRSGLGSPSFRGLLRLGFCFLQRCAGFGGVMLPVGLELHGTKKYNPDPCGSGCPMEPAAPST